MNNINYTKQYKINLKLYELKSENIEVLSNFKMNFYQKFLILILSKGIKAKSQDDLYAKLSILLNINNEFIKELVNVLIEKKDLLFTQHIGYRNYHLHESIKYEVNVDKNTFLCWLTSEKIDISFLYSPDLKKIFSKDYFEKENSKLIERILLDDQSLTDNDPLANSCDLLIFESPTSNHAKMMRKSTLNDHMMYKIDIEIINRELNKECVINDILKSANYCVKNTTQVEVINKIVGEITLEIKFIAQYRFNFYTGLSKLVDINVINDYLNNIPELIDYLSNEFLYDDDLPMFIKYEKNYNRSIRNLINCINNVAVAKSNKLREINSCLSSISKNKENEENSFKNNQYSTVTIDKEFLECQLADVNRQLMDNENKLKSINYRVDDDLIQMLEYENKNLKEEISSIEDTLSKHEATSKAANNEKNVIKPIIPEVKEFVYDTLTRSMVRVNDNPIYDNQSETQNYFDGNNSKTTKINYEKFSLDSLINETLKNSSSPIKDVINKFLKNENVNDNFIRKLKELLFYIELSQDALSHKNVDECIAYLGKIRTDYTVLFKTIFDVITVKQENELGKYIYDKYKITKLNTMYKVDNNDIHNLEKFHTLLNKYHHYASNDDNKKYVNKFKCKMDDREKMNIVLVVPKILLSINLSPTEYTSIMQISYV